MRFDVLVEGTDAEIKEYEESQGELLHTVDDNYDMFKVYPAFFTLTALEDGSELKMSDVIQDEETDSPW